MKPSHVPSFLVLVLLFVCMAQTAAKAAVDYFPGVMIGSKKANALLGFLWFSSLSKMCGRV